MPGLSRPKAAVEQARHPGGGLMDAGLPVPQEL